MGESGDMDRTPLGLGGNPRDMGHLRALTGGHLASTPHTGRTFPLPAGYPRGDGSDLWGVNEDYGLPVLQCRSLNEGRGMGAQGRHLGSLPHTAPETPSPSGPAWAVWGIGTPVGASI